MDKEARAALLKEIDEQIFRVAQEGSEKIRQRATVGEINADMDFLRTLMRRRDVMLNEARKEGLQEKDFY